MTPSVAPNRPRWRMHAPMLAFLLALAILILAAARPQKTVAVPVELTRATSVAASPIDGPVLPPALPALDDPAEALFRG